MNLKRHHVISSWIKSAGYDLKENIFEIELKDGSVFRHRIPLEEYMSFRNSRSKGAYYSEHIQHRS